MNKKIATEIALGIVMIVAIVVGGVFWLGNNKVQAPTQDEKKTQPTNQTSAADEITNWKIYTNAEFGYEMKYPADFSEPSGPFGSLNNPAAASSQKIPGLAFQVQFLDAFSPKTLEEAFQTSIRGNGYQEKLKRNIVFNGLPAIEYAGINNARNVHALVGELNGKFFDLVVESKNSQEETDALFQKMLASLKDIK